MSLDGLLAQHQLGCHLRIGHAIRDQLQYFHLTLAELRERV